MRAAAMPSPPPVSASMPGRAMTMPRAWARRTACSWRTLTDIAHSEMWFGAIPDVIDSNGAGGWTSGADQSLLFQTTSDAVTQVGVHTCPDPFGFFTPASGSFAWTSQLAEQSLQPGFDPNLVTLFDKQAQGAVAQANFSTGGALAISINTSVAQAIQGTSSSPFGFADF